MSAAAIEKADREKFKRLHVESLTGLAVLALLFNAQFASAELAPLTLEEAENRVAEACRKHGKAWGRPAFSAEDLEALAGRGGQLIAYGGDFGFLLAGLQRNSKDFERVR